MQKVVVTVDLIAPNGQREGATAEVEFPHDVSLGNLVEQVIEAAKDKAEDLFYAKRKTMG